MDTIGLAWKFTRSKQTVYPPQVFADCSFARDSLLQAASRLSHGDVIDEAIGAQVDAVLPQTLLEFLAVEPQQGAVDRDLNRFGSALTFPRHIPLR